MPYQLKALSVVSNAVRFIAITALIIANLVFLLVAICYVDDLSVTVFVSNWLQTNGVIVLLYVTFLYIRSAYFGV